MNVEILSTKLGGSKLRVNGFIYRIQERRNTYIKWKCEEERCNGRLRTNLDMENAEESGVHRHGPLEQSVVQAGQLRIALTAEVKLRPHVSVGQVHRELTVDADPNVVTHLTSGPSLKRSLRKTKSINRPRLPTKC